MSKKICVLYGDGIGPLVVDEAVRVISSLRQDISFEYARIGFGAYQELGSSLPNETVEMIKNSDASLFGAVMDGKTTPDMKGNLKTQEVTDYVINGLK